MQDAEAREFLSRICAGGDGPHDIATAALMLASFDHPGTKLEPFRAHLAELGEAVRNEIAYAANVTQAALGLARIMTTRFGYDGDRTQYDNPENADLMSVIHRRRGLPVALGILYIHAARGAGLDARGLLSPGHFLLMIRASGSDAVLDPFSAGIAMERDQLKGPPLLTVAGKPWESSSLSPVSDIDVLLRLENNIKTRALQVGNVVRAADILSRMVLIAPARAPLWLEWGRLQEANGALGAARASFENCLAKGDDATSNEASLALNSLKRRLN